MRLTYGIGVKLGEQGALADHTVATPDRPEAQFFHTPNNIR
jgi:hypothetical protein